MTVQSAYGDMTYSSLTALQSAAAKLVKPWCYSALQNVVTGQYLMTTNSRAKLFVVSNEWHMVGSAIGY
jgi:hypothetical protein